MAVKEKTDSEIPIVEATEANVPSLTTILPRAFFPVNPFLRKTVPDTPLVRAWWQSIFTDEIRDPAVNVLTAIDVDTGINIGVLILRLMDPSSNTGGVWTRHPPTEDHDKVPYEAMIKFMTDNEHVLMSGQEHYNIGLLGVDHEFKGRGIGIRLLERACQIADETGHAMFVQANGSAIGLYGRLGFESKKQILMPGDVEYMEHLLVRPAVASEGNR